MSLWVGLSVPIFLFLMKKQKGFPLLSLMQLSGRNIFKEKIN
jgi:hypothetical protein